MSKLNHSLGSMLRNVSGSGFFAFLALLAAQALSSCTTSLTNRAHNATAVSRYIDFDPTFERNEDWKFGAT